jgi:hypothetical protein
MANHRVAQRPACTFLGIQRALEDVLRRARGILWEWAKSARPSTRSRPLGGTRMAVVRLPWRALGLGNEKDDNHILKRGQ